MLKHLITIASVAILGACQTMEDDYGLPINSIAERCDNRMNRPVVSASANGSYSAAPVNTQSVGCAGTTRTFEIIGDRTGG